MLACMASLAAKVVAAYLRLTRKPSMATLERARARIAEPKGPHAPPRSLSRRCDLELRSIAGAPCYLVTPRGATSSSVRSERAFVYLHGGSFVFEIVAEHWALIEEIVHVAGATAYVPIYPLAPQASYREAHAMLLAVHALVVERFPPERVAIVGDSAGGGLALSFAQAIAAAQLAQLGRLVLIAPWLDVTMTNPDIDAVEPLDPWLTRVGLVESGKAWAHGDDRTDWRISPIYGALEGLPPISLFVGTHDMFVADARKLRDRGASIDLHEADGLMHVYPLTPTPEGRSARSAILQIIRSM